MSSSRSSLGSGLPPPGRAETVCGPGCGSIMQEGRSIKLQRTPVCTQDLVLYSTGPIKTPLCPQTSAAAALAYLAV
jgi:hypothetical protein